VQLRGVLVDQEDKPMEKHTCKFCQKYFLEYASKNPKYCSKKCFYSSDAKSHLRKTKPNSICKICGVYFRVKPSWVKDRKHCSKKCSSKALSLLKIGKKPPYMNDIEKKREAIKKMSKSLTGRTSPRKGATLSYETRKKISIANKNSNSEWNGFVKDNNTLEREKFRRDMQKTIFERDSYTCQMCDTRGGSLQVDHIQPWSEYVCLRFSADNCRTLCMSCHYFITFGKKKPEHIVWGHNLKHRSIKS